MENYNLPPVSPDKSIQNDNTYSKSLILQKEAETLLSSTFISADNTYSKPLVLAKEAAAFTWL